MSRLDDYAERKALLVLKSDLERLRLTAAAHQVQTTLTQPLWGQPRLGLLLRSLSIALAAYRIFRVFRR
jgi:hypothetical protein